MCAPPDLTTGEIAALDRALEQSADWLEARQNVDAVAEGAGDGLQIMRLAFSYELVNASDVDTRTRVGGPFASIIGIGEDAYPPAPQSLKPDVLDALGRAATRLTHPAASARLLDVRYAALGRSAHADGKAAAESLAELAERKDWKPLSRATVIGRALEIATELGDRDAATRYGSIGVALVDDFAKLAMVGPALMAIRAVGVIGKRQPPGFQESLDRVVAAYESTPSADAVYATCIRFTTDRFRRTLLQRRRVDELIAQAKCVDGLRRAIQLHSAMETAHKYELNDIAEALLLELQETSPDALGFERITAETSVPRDEIERLIDGLAGTSASGTLDALGAIGAIDPPGGSNADVDAVVAQQDTETPLLRLLGPTHIFNGSAVAVYSAVTDEQKAFLGRGRQRTLAAEFTGHVLIAPALDRSVQAHARPTTDDLVAHFSTELIGETRSRHIARALEYFWDGQFDDAAHILIPRLEAVLRDLAKAAGVPVFKRATPGTYGGYITLGTVMRKLREPQDENAWLDYLEALLCEPTSLNLRNNVCHGLVDEVSRVHAALLIQAACHLALLRRIETDNTADS